MDQYYLLTLTILECGSPTTPDAVWMRELDECDQLLVQNPFQDSSDRRDALVVLTASSEHHPLCSPSVSPAQSISSTTVVDSEGEPRPRWTPLHSLDQDVQTNDRTTEGGSPRGGNDTVVHTVGSNDSLASVALRYGVSIAALRRANQLWPSDPVHLRTELLIPRGDTLHIRHKGTRSRNASTDTAVRPAVEPMSRLSPDRLASSLASVRNMFFSALPGRISLESLSSKTSTTEDHELDDFQAPLGGETPFAQEGYELSVFGTPRVRRKRLHMPLSWQVPTPSTDNQPLDPDRIPPSGASRSQSISSSSAVSLRPFAVSPVRTSQLEPEPAMELPVRRSQLNHRSPWSNDAGRAR